MIKIKDIEIKNNINEYTIKEFTKITKILTNKETDYIDKYIEIFSYLGVSDDILEDLSIDDFIEYINNFNDDVKIENKLLKSFELNGFNYIAYEGDEFKLKIKDMALIENAIKENQNDYIAKVIAIIFKRSDLSNNEHYDKNHLKYKTELFNNLKLIDFYPYVIYIQEKVLNKMKVIINE